MVVGSRPSLLGLSSSQKQIPIVSRLYTGSLWDSESTRETPWHKWLGHDVDGDRKNDTL